MLRPNFEEFLDTAEQLLENNLTLIAQGGEIFKTMLSQSNNTDYKKLAEKMVFPIWSELDNVFDYQIHGNGTHALLGSNIHSSGEGNWKRKWHRSKDRVEGLGTFPFAGYISNKKWHLNEVEIV